jgi:cytochrome P450 family 135
MLDSRSRWGPKIDGMPRRVPLPALAQTLWALFGVDSFRQFCLTHFAEEKMLTFRILGLGEVVSVLDPQLIREVFTGDSDVLRAGEVNAQAFGVLGPNSLLLLDGAPHLRTRRLLLPPFHGEAIRRHAELIEQITAAEVDRWPLGERFALWPRMQAITMEVILRAVIGVRDESRRRRLGELLPAFVRGGLFGALAEAQLPGLMRGAIGRRLPWVRARAEGEELLYQEISDHRASPEDRDDILALLVAARDEDGCPPSDEELRDHVLTLLGAGHDTTAAALAWCFERLLRHPDVLARCREADPGDEDYLTAVVNETLRIRPVVDSAARKLSAPFELGGYRLPAGTIVAASIAGMQLSPQIYRDPLRFSPTRFLEQPAPYTFIPFGGGTRRCIGASFATMEIKTVLRTVLGRVELRAADLRDERPSRTRSVGIVPARGARAIATTRLAGNPSAHAG